MIRVRPKGRFGWTNSKIVAPNHDESEHGREVVLAVERALVEQSDNLPREVAQTMFAVVYNHVRAPLKRAIEAMIMELKLGNRMVEIPPFLQTYVEEGQIKQARSTLVRLAKSAGILLTNEQRKRIDTCTDLSLLDQWFENALHAKTAADVFGEG